MSQENLSVSVTVSFDEQKVAALVKEFQHRLVNECLVIKPKDGTEVEAAPADEFDKWTHLRDEKLAKLADRPSIVMEG